jgi:hypothetical protein
MLLPQIFVGENSRTEDGDVGRTWLAQGIFVVGMLLPI